MIAVANAIIEPETNTTYCRVINAGFTARRLRPRTPIATVSHVAIDRHNNSHLLPTFDSHCMAISDDTPLPSHEERMASLKALGIPFQDTSLSTDQLIS